jgi:Protein of unknown function (DUF1573)
VKAKLCLVAWLAVAFGGTAIPVISEESSLENKPTKSVLVSLDLYDKRPVDSKNFELGECAEGEQVEAKVVINNKIDIPVTLEKVEVSCSCMSARVPDKIVAANESVVAYFQFSLPKISRKLEERFSVVILCSGGRDAIRLNFSARVQDLVAFSSPEVSKLYTKSSKESVFRVPIVCESPDALEGAKIAVADSLPFLKTKILHEKKDSFLECRFSSIEVKETSSVGTILLTSRKGKKSEVLCRLKLEADVEVLPNKLTFTYVDTTQNEYAANAVLKLKKAEDSERKTKVIRIVCRRDDIAEDLDVKYSQVSTDVFRVSLRTKIGDEQARNGKLHWVVTNDLGEEIRLSSQFSLAN